MADRALTPQKAQLRAIFERLAPEYDPEPGCFAYFGQRLVAEAGLAPEQRVLDLATGRGALLIPAAEAVGNSGLVVGCDLAAPMVRAARTAVHERGLHAECQIMDAETLAFSDGAFDRVLCGFGLMFFPRPDAALAEYRRVLRPGGRLALSTWRVTQTADLDAVLAERGLLGADNGVLRFAEPDSLVRLLEAADFRVLTARIETADFRYADLDQYWQSARGTGIRRWLDQLDARQASEVRAALETRVAARRHPQGLDLPATAVFVVAER